MWPELLMQSLMKILLRELDCTPQCLVRQQQGVLEATGWCFVLQQFSCLASSGNTSTSFSTIMLCISTMFCTSISCQSMFEIIKMYWTYEHNSSVQSWCLSCWKATDQIRNWSNINPVSRSDITCTSHSAESLFNPHKLRCVNDFSETSPWYFRR